MMSKHIPIFIAIVVFLGTGTSASARALDSETELRAAVQSLNSWLGADDRARRWRQILDLNVLDAQAALGHRADSQALHKLQQLFASDIEGLSHPVFRRVKHCIDAQLQQLARNKVDITFAMDQAKSDYQVTSLDELDRMRNDAIYNVKMLRQFYKVRLRSRERALLYYDLQPDETVDFLSSAEFELPPTRSKKVIENEVKAIELQIESVEKQIQELNAQREKILEWLNDPKIPDDAKPPMPDDDEPILDDQGTAIESTEPKVTNTTSLNPQRQDEIKRIENGRTLLLQRKEDLQLQIEKLNQEIQQLTESERKRIDRFRKMLGQYNSYLDRYEALRTDRNDVYFGQAFNALLNLKAAYLAAANPNTKSLYLDRLNKLHDVYMARPDDSARRAFAQIGNLTGWLEGAQQAEDLVAAVRAQHSLPNLYFELSNGLVNELAGRNVREVRRVNEQILSRLIRGQAFVNGNVSVQFVPDPYQAHAAIDFTGSIDSDTYARSGKFTAYAGATGQFNVRRDFFANVGGLFACDVYGDLQLESFFKCIDSSWKLVQKIARKQYCKSKLRAEEISRERTAAKLFPQFEEESDESLEGAYAQFASLNRQQTDNGQVIPSLYLFTTADRLVAVGHRATSFDLAAPDEPQFFDRIASDVHIKLHESMLSNFISPLLAGKRLTNKEIADQFQQLLGRSIAADEGEESEDFSVLFDDSRPVQIEFDNNVLSVTIFGKEFSRDGKRIRDGLRIHLDFKLVNYGDRLEFRPDSNVSVELIDPKRTNIGTVSFKNFLEDRLSDVMANAGKTSQQIPLNLIPSDNLGPAIANVTENLDLVQFRTEGGWLYLGWKYQAHQSLQHFAVDTPAIWLPTVENGSDTEPPAREPDVLDLNDQLDDVETSTGASLN